MVTGFHPSMAPDRQGREGDPHPLTLSGWEETPSPAFFLRRRTEAITEPGDLHPAQHAQSADVAGVEPRPQRRRVMRRHFRRPEGADNVVAGSPRGVKAKLGVAIDAGSSREAHRTGRETDACNRGRVGVVVALVSEDVAATVKGRRRSEKGG